MSKLLEQISNRRFRKRIEAIVMFLFFGMSFFLSTNLSATHIVGGGINYRCLGNNQYEVTLRVYRDCFFGASNALFDDPASIGIFDGQSSFRIGEVKIPLGPQNDTLDVVIADTCLFVPATVCVHTTTYVDTITLAPRSTGYILAYQRCCRNQTILNIVEPLETGATFIASITEEALLECNNQAVYKNFPPLFICVNEPVDFDHSAIDVDGDSLVYKLCTPFNGASSSSPQPSPPSSPPYDEVVWSNPYDLNNLLGGDALTIDPNTGFLTGVPSIIGQFVVGVCVEEYRNGALISETRRDFQYNVGECGIVEAVIGNASTLCDNLTADFINNSTNATTFNWDFGDPTTSNDVSTEFQPSYTYPDTGLYNVVLTVEVGSDCEDVLNFPLYVKYSTVSANFNTATFECENGDIIVAVEDTSVDPENDITDWNWVLSDGQTSSDQHPVFIVSNTGQNISITLEVTADDTCSDAITQLYSPGDNNLGGLTSPSTICDGQSVELYPEFLALNQNLSYSWSPTTNLTNSNIANPSANPVETTTYTLTVSIPNSDCVAKIDKLVNVGDFTDLEVNAVLTDSEGNQTVVDGDNTIIVCDGQTTELTVTNSASAITTVEWLDENNNVISNNTTVAVNPNGSTTYTVNVVDENGCNGTKQVTVLPSTVDISIEELVNVGGGSGITDVDGDGTLDLCVGETSGLTVNNQNGFDLLTYQWTPSGGVISAGANSATPTIFGLAEGIYTLILITTNQYGCSRQDEVMISVHDITDLEIQTAITDLGDNTTTTVVGESEIINCNGNSTITLSETATSNNGNVEITWVDQDGNVVGTGPTVDVSPLGDVTYTVTVEDQYGCSKSEEVTILGNPVDITITESAVTGGSNLVDTDGDGDLDLCVGLTGSLNILNNNPDDILTYSWTGSIITGGENTSSPTLSASSPGEYLLTVIITNQYGCSKTDVVDVDVFDSSAVLGFTTEQDCAGTTISFNGQNSNFEFYTWDFGDTATGTTINGVQSPSYTYSEPGIYQVTLSPLPNLPCDLPTLITEVEVAETLVDIDFEIEYIDCTPENITVRFTDVTVTQIGTITDREWIFGDGQTSSAINPVITISQEGIFTVVLNVLNSANCDGSATESFMIEFIDVSGIPDEVIACPNEGRVELNSSPDNSLTYAWLPTTGLDDPTSPNPKASPNQTTLYSVLITSTSGADVCEITKNVTVIVPEDIDIDVDAEGTASGEIILDQNSNSNTITTCEEETITLTATTTTGMSNDFDIVWTDSNGNVLSDMPNITVAPGATETYTITYTDEFGCSESNTVTVEGGPVNIDIETSFIDDGSGNGIGGIINDDGFLELCLGQDFTLNVTNLDNVDELTYSWSGDDVISSGANTGSPVVSPNDAGSYTIYLETENQFGCTQLDTVDINVIDADALLSFDEIKDCNGVTVLFTNTSTGNNDDYIWTFGDAGNPNASSNEIDPEYTYPGVGTYMVTLGLETQVTCVDDFVQAVNIVSPILASNFSYEFVDCSEDGVTIQFAEESTNPQDNTNGYLWDFGNGETSTEPNPSLFFDEDDELNVSLTVFTEIDCESISQVQNIVIRIIDDIQGPATVLACENDGPQIIDLGGSANYTYAWSPAAGLDDPTSATPMADPGVTTVYSVTITDITGSQPCSTIRTVEVFVPESIELTVPEDFDTDCGDEAVLTVSGNFDNLEYEWSLDGEILGNEDVLNLSSLSGPSTYIVTATDENGCEQTESVTVTGTQLDVDIDDLQFLCLNEEGELNVITSNDPNDMLDITWTGPNIISGGSSANPIIDTSEPVETTYTVEISNQYDCSTSAEVTVIVLDDNPIADFITYGQCDGLTVSFSMVAKCSILYLGLWRRFSDSQ